MAEYKPVTAQDRLKNLGPLVTDLENAKRAEEEGVTDASYVGYEEALKNYESRSDVETLEQRLAREVGPSFDAAKFARERGVLLGVDSKATEDPVADADAADERLKEAEEYKKAQAAHTAEVAAEHNEPTKLENDEDEEE